MKEFSNICFCGSGAWGQAIAITLARAGLSSKMLVNDSHRLKILNQNKSTCFPKVKFPDLISASSEISFLKKSDLVFISTESSKVLRTVNKIISLNPKSKIIVTSKGFANQKGETIPEVFAKNFPSVTYGILTGPTFADEVAKNLPAAAIFASNENSFAEAITSIFHKSCLRLYKSNDPIGASLGGTIKNIIAIGAGISDGLKLGENSKAGIITRGVAELSQIIDAAGGNRETAFGLAGIGDMMLSCSTPKSRNMKFGMSLVNPKNENKTNLVEGLNALKAVNNLSEILMLNTPIIDSINDIVNNKKDIKKIITELLNRPVKREFNKN